MARTIGISPERLSKVDLRILDTLIADGRAANINLAALGLTLVVIISIELESQTEDALARFEKAVRESAAILTCHFVSGDNDYVLTAVASSMAHYEHIYNKEISRLPHVARIGPASPCARSSIASLPPSCSEAAALDHETGAHWRAAGALAAVTSISTRKPGPARPATWTVDREGRCGCSVVPKYRP